MSIESGYEYRSESLGDDRIHHWVRVASVAAGRRDEGSRGAKLAMMSLCIVCLVIGSTAREITHWALGDTVFGPYAVHVARSEPYFRCGGGFLPAQSAEDENEQHGWSATDEADALPEPAF
jgi:hypothetical protein